jgi:cell division protein FtsB
MATTTRNIHQLDHENNALKDENGSLKARIAELEKELKI